MKSLIRAKWIVKIGPRAKIKCKVGDWVDKDQVIMEEGSDVVKSFDASIVLSRMPKEKVNLLNDQWRDKKLICGDVICETGGMVNKKIFAPIDGLFCGIDEFFNMTIREEIKDKKIVKAPVGAKVGEINKETIVLEFGAREVTGKGIVLGRVWGNADFKVIEQLSELDYSSDGKIILTNNTGNTFMTKAEVVGVVGMIVGEKCPDEMNADIPVLKISDDDMKKLVEMGEKNTLYRVLLNAKLERLLIAKGKE